MPNMQSDAKVRFSQSDRSIDGIIRNLAAVGTGYGNDGLRRDPAGQVVPEDAGKKPMKTYPEITEACHVITACLVEVQAMLRELAAKVQAL